MLEWIEPPYVYAGINAGVLFLWILIAAGVGRLARMIIGGPNPLGLFGDMAIALFGVFALGRALRAFNIDPSAMIKDLAPVTDAVAVYADVALVGFVGALILRVPLRILSR